MGLRERLIAAKLTSHTFTASDGYLSVKIHGQEEAADLALTVVAAWLRDEAGDIEAEHSGEPGRRHVPIVKHLRWLADSITGSTDAR